MITLKKTPSAGAPLAREIPAVPNVTADPRYRAVAAKHADLARRAAGVQTAIAALEEARQQAATPRAKTEAQAGALFKDPEAAFEDLGHGLDQQLRELHQELAIVQRAMRLAIEERERVEREISAETCRELRADYAGLIRRTADALVALSQCYDEHAEFRRCLDAAGVAHSSLPGFSFFGIGSLKEHDSRVNFWLREAREQGVLEDEAR